MRTTSIHLKIIKRRVPETEEEAETIKERGRGFNGLEQASESSMDCLSVEITAKQFEEIRKEVLKAF